MRTPAKTARNAAWVALRTGGHTLEEIAGVSGVTRERVRQIVGSHIAQPTPGVDPVLFLAVARRSISLAATVDEIGASRDAVFRCLSELGVLDALSRLWLWRQRRAKREQSLDALRKLASHIGRTPTGRDMLNAGLGPTTYYRLFGNLPSAQKLAGLTPHRTHWELDRTTECHRGHALTPENTYRYGSTRYCKVCRAAAHARASAAPKPSRTDA